MRNFEERMDEIRRRSNLILRNRKRRRKQLLVCVPVVVCSILLVSLITNLPGKTSAPPVCMEAAPELELLQDKMTLYSMQLSPGEVHEENKEDVNQSAEGSTILGESAWDDFNYDISAPLGEQATDCCCFKAVSEDGAVTYYKLEGNLLTNTLTGQARELTQAQLEDLLQLLEERGITP